jgi:hypothetical protein
MQNSVETAGLTSALKLAYWLIVASLIATGCAFYYWQNSGQALGGSIALPKLFWLAYALWFWYFLPLLIVADQRICPQIRQNYWIFWVNMALRAIAELWMMYISKNWHPYWGIGHDIFSAILIGILGLKVESNIPLDRQVKFNLKIMGLMFLLETVFATYMLLRVASPDGGSVYFVPGSSQHLVIMAITWTAVIALSIQQILFYQKWTEKSTEKLSAIAITPTAEKKQVSQ